MDKESRIEGVRFLLKQGTISYSEAISLVAMIVGANE